MFENLKILRVVIDPGDPDVKANFERLAACSVRASNRWDEGGSAFGKTGGRTRTGAAGGRTMYVGCIEYIRMAY